MRKVIFCSIFVFYSFCFPSTVLSAENDKVTLQLKWFHQFQFAGYYAAKEKGFYNDLGLDVDIKEKELSINNIEQVINGDSEYGIADSVLVLYKAKNESVVIVSPIFQHSPSVLISLKKDGIESPYELTDKDLLFYDNDADGFSILSMLNKLRVKPNLVREKEKNDYLKLINEEIDLIPAYLSNELFYFKEKNIDINIINPMNYGVDLYGDMLFTNQNEAKNHPERVKKFKTATLKGWEYALENKEEIIQLIHEKYNSNKSIAHLRYEANAIEEAISKDSTPLGTVDKGRMQYIYDLYTEYGFSLNKLDLTNFIFDDYAVTRTQINLTQEEKDYLLQHPLLKVQNMISSPPYNFNENGIPKGYSIDFVSLLAEKMGVEIEFVSGKTWQESLQMLKNGEVDILPNIAANQERKEYIDFTSFKTFDYNISATVRKGKIISSMDDLQEKVIAVLKHSFLQTILEENYPQQKLYLAPTVKDAVEAVANGEADAVIGNSATIEYYINQSWISNLQNINIKNLLGRSNINEMYLGVSKGNLALKSILEKANALITHNEIQALKTKWVNINDFSKVEFTNQELEYLQSKQLLNLCIDPNWLPFEKIENDEHIGMTAEYIKLFQKELPIPIKLINTKNWLETLEFSKRRQCDFVSVMMPSDTRRMYLNFTKPLMNMPVVIATSHDKPFINDMSSVASEKFGITEGFAYEELLKKEYPNIKLIKVKNPKEGLLRVKQGKLYGHIGVLPAIGYNINESYVGDLKIAGKLRNTATFSMATRNDEPLLNSIFNKLISEISVQENKDILNKWLSIKYEEQVDYTNVVILSLFLLSIILVVLYKNRSINHINSQLESYIKIVDENVLTSATDINGKITYASRAFCETTGYSKKELIGQNHNIVKHDDTDPKVYKGLWKRLSTGLTWKGEIKNKKKDGSFYWVDATVSPQFDKNNNIIGYTSIRHDITDKKIIEEISITDALTNIYNRRHFNDVFPKYINSLKRDNSLFSFLILDVDYFKQYNDIYGHQQGDEVLKSIAQVLQSKVHRGDDYCFRLGGEEFGLLFKSSNKENILKFVDGIRESIENLHIEHSGNAISQYITVSIGLYSDFASVNHDINIIFKEADDLLYKAKENGRNQTMFNVVPF